MDTNKDYSIKATVYLALCDGNVPKVVIEQGLTYNTTITELKLKLCSLTTNIGHQQVDPDKAKLIWDLDKLEDNITLGSLPSSPILRRMFLLPDITRARWHQEFQEEARWLDICTRVREAAQQEEVEVEEGVIMSLSREKKRPKINGQLLPYAQFGGLLFHGDCLEFGCHVPVASKIETLPFSLSTVASVVLLVPNIRIFNTVLSSLPSPSMSKYYLVICVSWDVLSYVFLRRFRRRYAKLPFVAVTDLDPHHLDLFTFLDTPPLSVIKCYGWDLGLDVDDEETSFIDEYEFAEIAWLGLRPSQLHELKRFDGQARAPDFCKVIRMVEVNPYLRCKKKNWLEELKELERYGKTMLLEPLDKFIFKKISEEDWI